MRWLALLWIGVSCRTYTLNDGGDARRVGVDATSELDDETGETAGEDTGASMSAPRCDLNGTYTVDRLRCGTFALDWLPTEPAQIVDGREDGAEPSLCALVLVVDGDVHTFPIRAVDRQSDKLVVSANGADGDDVPPEVECPLVLVADLYK